MPMSSQRPKRVQIGANPCRPSKVNVHSMFPSLFVTLDARSKNAVCIWKSVKRVAMFDRIGETDKFKQTFQQSFVDVL